ncbi:MAG: maleylacetoacetate isomerase [Hyphomonadaceae bacterium]|nr:maleylacetoacetate isomerase [Hyphomonadaceae bacterium]
MLKVYDYWRSGTSHRLRIALALKGVAYTQESIDLLAAAQRSPDHLARNPQGFVPVLETGDGMLTQSPAIIEWLDETYPDPPLLPREPFARAKVRAIAMAVACDIHPLGNTRVLKYLRDGYGKDDAAIADWALRWIRDGFTAIEQMLADGPGGPWCWGDRPGYADVCLVPQIYAAVSRYGLMIRNYPRLAEIDMAAAAHPAFQAAHPTRHPDAR